MKIRSTLSKRAYLAEMKQQMREHLSLDERFTGFFLGNLFSVTYHSGYEHDRRYNNPKNSALGYVVQREDGCEVRFFRYKGTNLPTMIVIASAFSIYLFLRVSSAGLPFSFWMCLGLSFGCMLFFALIGGFFEGLISERSIEGGRVLLSFLTNPSDPYGNFHKIP